MPRKGGKFEFRAALRDALREALVGLAFALIVAPLIFCLTDKGHTTLNLSQQLFLLFNRPGGALGDSAASGPSIPKKWFFVDLNGGFCKPTPQSKRCPPESAHTDYHALGQLLKNILAQGPRLVVLDVLVLDEADTASGGLGGGEGLKTVLDRSESPVILSWFPNSGKTDAPILSPENDALLYALDGTKAPARVRYLPAVKALVGPGSLYLLPRVQVALSERVQSFPTVAYGAALVLQDPTLRRLDGFPTASQHDDCNLIEPVACAEYETTRRIFSFPPRRPHAAPSFLSNTTPFYARVVPDGDDPQLDRLGSAVMKDAVVVIGNSDASAGDQTWSAVGNVSGAEIILNDIRQYLLRGPEAERGFFVELIEWLWSERWFYVLSLCSIFVAQVAVDFQWPLGGHAAGKHGTPTVGGGRPTHEDYTWRHLLRELFKLALEVVLAFLLYYGAIVGIAHRLIDVVSPFLGGLVQALVESLYHLKRLLDDFAMRLSGKKGD